MKYKVTIEVEQPKDEDEKYAMFDSIYEQVVEALDIEAVIKATNGL